MTTHHGPLERAVAERLVTWRDDHFAERLFRRDSTLWSAAPASEVENSLGWLDLPETMAERTADLEAWVDEIRRSGVRDVVLLGMGGSSLAAELFARAFGGDGVKLTVLDSTHPGTVSEVTARIAVEATLFLVASKSGTTVETLSLFRHFWEVAEEATENPGRRFVAITDPDTPLQELARERGFRKVFTAPPDVGGRFSALSVFGLVPAALVGAPLGPMLDAARSMGEACGGAEGNPGLELGAMLGEAASAGRDKLILLTPPELGGLSDWIEQLVAESTGKHGRGLLPVPGPTALDPGGWGDDVVVVATTLAGGPDRLVANYLEGLHATGHPLVEVAVADAEHLGAELLRWEVATAAAGVILSVNPFDQPDVQLAKTLAARALGGELDVDVEAWELGDPATRARLDRFVDELRPGDYLAIQAFLHRSPTVDRGLSALARSLRARTTCPVTVAYGPRFLHSTGQLHKGGPATGRFVQLVDDPQPTVPIPGAGGTFGELVRAQADGDLSALRERGRPIARLNLGADPAEGLARLVRRV